MDNLLTCQRCLGTGKHSIGSNTYDCHWCRKIGHFKPVDWQRVINTIINPKTGKVKAKKPSGGLYGTAWTSLTTEQMQFLDLADYVWRMVRFHGGIDVTLPVSFILKRPDIKEIDLAVDIIAKKACGSNMAAAYRWHNALGGSVSVPSNQPLSAFSGGPEILEAEVES